MSYIRRTNTNKGRGHQRGLCPRCNKKGLGPMKIWPAVMPFVARQCRYCRAHVRPNLDNPINNN